MKRQTSILLAVLACVFEFILFIFIGALLGWKHGGGVIPIVLFFWACRSTWKAIINLSKDGKENEIPTREGEIMGIVMSAVLLLIAIFATIIYNFSIVSIIIDLILVCLLAFAISSYEKKKESVNDIVNNTNEKPEQEKKENTNENNIISCSKCGQKLSNNDKFCIKCGNKIK